MAHTACPTNVNIHSCFKLSTYSDYNFRGTLSAYAYSTGDDSCPSHSGMSRTWKYGSSNGWVDAGDGLEVVCSDSGATKI